MNIGDIVWTEAFGHTAQWIVLEPNCRGLVKLYQIQRDGGLVEFDNIICKEESELILTEADAIQKAIQSEKKDFEWRVSNHNDFLEKMAKKLGQINESKAEKND